MSCSGETVEVNNEFIQIKPMILNQLKKAKYGVSDHSTVEHCAIGQKSRLEMKAIVTNTSFMVSQPTGVWNSHLPECFVRIGVYIVGAQWNFIVQ